MLDRDKLARVVGQASEVLFKAAYRPQWLTLGVWWSLTSDPRFNERITKQRDAHHLVTWQGNLADILMVQADAGAYAVLAVDGSQIYPDRHLQGVECFLINTGGCFLSYLPSGSSVELFSEPLVYTPTDVTSLLPSLAFAADAVDLIREDKEFVHMANRAIGFQQTVDDYPLVCLVDGNLYFWHLESKSADVRSYFLAHYLKQLKRLHERRIVVAGYLSSTHFRDVVQLVKVGLCDDPAACAAFQSYAELCSVIDSITDAELLASILPMHHRTTVFACNATLVEAYPEELRPHFFYFNVGSEIVRIEIPAWIASDQALIAQVCAVCLDQCSKGYGYPVALAEAHAQAVVHGADREFFYQMIYALGVANNKQIVYSPKSMKKKILGF